MELDPTTIRAVGHLYAAFCLATVFFQIAIILGAPVGVYTQGGQHKGALPIRNRIFAALSIVLLAFMGASALSAVGFDGLNWPIWTLWIAMAIQAMSTVANLITPSEPERRVWGPITSLMLALLVIVAMG